MPVLVVGKRRLLDPRQSLLAQALRSEQAEARCEKSLDGQWRDGLARNKRLERLDEQRRGLERKVCIAEHVAMADNALIGQHVGQYERRLHDRAARGSMRLD